MWKVTRYIVKRQASGATVPDAETFYDEASAMRRAAFIGRRSPAHVYAVTGEPVSDLWGAMQVIATFDGAALRPDPVSNVIPFRRAV